MTHIWKWRLCTSMGGIAPRFTHLCLNLGFVLNPKRKLSQSHLPLVARHLTTFSELKHLYNGLRSDARKSTPAGKTTLRQGPAGKMPSKPGIYALGTVSKAWGLRFCNWATWKSQDFPVKVVDEPETHPPKKERQGTCHVDPAITIVGGLESHTSSCTPDWVVLVFTFFFVRLVNFVPHR